MVLRRLVVPLISIVALVATAWLLLDPVQRLLIFRPAIAELEGFHKRISGYEDVWIPLNEAGDRIHAWWVPAEQVPAPERAPALLYLHGARWNLTGSASRIAAFQKMGFNVLAIDYRGFGKSTMRLPSERSALEDAMAAWDWLTHRVKEPRRRIIYGHSIGGAIATDLALLTREAAALVIEGTFTSVKDMARRSVFLGLFPLDMMVTQELDTLRKIGAIGIPIIIIHGNGDTIVPAAMAKQLYEAAAEPKRLFLADGYGHLRPVRGVAQELRRELLTIACPDSAAQGYC